MTKANYSVLSVLVTSLTLSQLQALKLLRAKFAFLKVLLISNAADVPATMTLEGIGFAIAIALAAQVISATLIGAVLPLVAVAVRQDPAVVSGPALTTIVDLTGLLLYFTITASMLGLAVP